ncbi:hypothetical protein CFC21_081259 [Triticum aestivum]|uniref:SnoaL-like domain-containing protein n=2 Tax=Triticum aestivum TaxID=4565 RepID=A0A3B6N4G4_WHEAT|nr:uncharacterized protein LOC123124019 [Triticum aestivum]KAF7076637.1 hypothetical protein CFC21_081259 [Triticum aestivum]
MNSALTLVSFQSPSLNLKQHPPSRRQQISAKWEKRQQCSPKPIRSIPGPKATRGLNKAFHGDGDNALTDVIHEFYSSLNDKDIARLMELIDPDCTVDHASYYKPLNFKKTMTYFARLMGSMGENAKFAIDEVCQGVEPTVAVVMWHLEWKGKIIPFTEGLSFYTCSANGEELLIRKVHIFNDSPVKQGNRALDILHSVAYSFDKNPESAEKTLQDTQGLGSFVKLYELCVELTARLFRFVVGGLVTGILILYSICKEFM